MDQFGNVFNFNNVPLDGQGQNFFRLSSADGQVAVSFSLISTVDQSNQRSGAGALGSCEHQSFLSLARWLCWVSVCSALPG